jgi:mannose-6-phosphate isomerase-like protein (cupin superfamily)
MLSAMDTVNLDNLAADITSHWAPVLATALNDYDVKLVKVQGEWTWHQHSDTDELFLVLDGELTIDLPDGAAAVLGPNELYVVPRATQHRPRADRETTMLLIEPRGVPQKGDQPDQ